MAHPTAVTEEPPPAGPVQEAPVLGGTTTPPTELPPPVESPDREPAAPAAKPTAVEQRPAAEGMAERPVQRSSNRAGEEHRA
eukprot:9543045-Alexandrium_andersonii.AAC.1